MVFFELKQPERITRANVHIFKDMTLQIMCAVRMKKREDNFVFQFFFPAVIFTLIDKSHLHYISNSPIDISSAIRIDEKISFVFE